MPLDLRATRLEPRLGGLPQGAHLHLLVAGEDELGLVEEEHAARHLVGRQALAQLAAQAGFGRRGSLHRHDAEHHDLAERRVSHAHRRGQPYLGVTRQRLLHLDGRDVGAPGLDQVGEAARPVQVALGVEVADSETVDAAATRFDMSGLATEQESAVACCHALQDKVWVTAPDGERWEYYRVIADVESAPECTDSSDGSDCRSDTTASAVPV